MLISGSPCLCLRIDRLQMSGPSRQAHRSDLDTVSIDVSCSSWSFRMVHLVGDKIYVLGSSDQHDSFELNSKARWDSGKHFAHRREVDIND